VTDLSWPQIRAEQLAEAIRQHWHVEVRREVALVEWDDRIGGSNMN